jgi:Flp pilus assembly secretin CpaC
MRAAALCWLVLGIVAPGSARADDAPVATTPAAETTAKVDASPGETPQIRLELKVVEVSLSRMQQAKLDFAQFGLRTDAKAARPGGRKPLAFTGQQTLARESAAAMLDKLSQQKAVLKVLAEPSLITSDRRAVYFFASRATGAKGKKNPAERKLGAQVAATPTLLGENQIDLKLHVVATELDPLLSVALRGGTAPEYRTREMDTEIKMELGATTVCGGLVQSDTREVVDPKTRRRSNAQVESETLFLVTLELATPQPSESETLTATRTKPK